MEGENKIVNKIAESGLLQLDLEQYCPAGKRILFDLREWLHDELVLKEKEFRERLKSHDWNQYTGCYVAIDCTADAIVPTWAFMLVASHLSGHAKKIAFGNLDQLEKELFREQLQNLNTGEFQDKKIVIKGCSEKVPASAYVDIVTILKPVAQSIMFGEPCSTVPVYKRPVINPD